MTGARSRRTIYVRIIRWMEGLFAVMTLLLLGFLPMPPHGSEIVSFTILSVGFVSATLIWWGLRAPTRLAWWGALAVSGAWLLLNVMSKIGYAWRAIVGILTGHAGMHDAPPAFVIAFALSLLPMIAQAVILVAWLSDVSLSLTTRPALRAGNVVDRPEHADKGD